MSTPELRPEWLGRVPYADAWSLQDQRRTGVIAGTAPEAVWLLEHDPVITTGRRSVEDLPSEAVLAERGITLYRTERGGLATWHGPGQLVGYLILDLPRRGLGIRRYVCALEQGLIDWLSTQGVAAHRREGYTGVWVGRGKVAAIGIHARRGVTLHGFALNLSPDLGGFDLIVPCGITDGEVTTVRALAGQAPTPADAAIPVGNAVLAAVVDAAKGERYACDATGT